MDDPAMDLAVVAAVLSSNVDIAVAKQLCFAAEIGLAGEVRPVPRIEQRIAEAQKMGFESMVISNHSKLSRKFPGIELIQIGKVNDLVKHLFG